MTVLTALFGYFTFLFKRVVIKVCCQNGYECLRKHLSVWQIDWKRYKVADRLSKSPVTYLVIFLVGWAILKDFLYLFAPNLSGKKQVMTSWPIEDWGFCQSIFCFCCVLFSSREMEDVWCHSSQSICQSFICAWINYTVIHIHSGETSQPCGSLGRPWSLRNLIRACSSCFWDCYQPRTHERLT